MPKIFRMTKDGKLNEGIFKGETINTPSMLAVEDAVDGLGWAESIGGLKGLIARSEANLAAIAGWVAGSAWAGFLAEVPATRSCTSICLSIKAPWFAALDAAAQAAAAKKLAGLLEKEGVALDRGPIATRLRACGSGAAPRSRPRISRRCCPGWIGPSPRSRRIPLAKVAA